VASETEIDFSEQHPQRARRGKNLAGQDADRPELYAAMNAARSKNDSNLECEPCSKFTNERLSG
jgi:hypothetical protein